MLKFFRRIRRNLLDQGRLKNYLIYALGEMLLVMFGILLAIQVNNFNEKRKNNQYIESLITALEHDLVENIQDANVVIEWGIEKDSLIDLVLSNRVTEEMYASDIDLNQLVFTGYEHRVIAGNVASLLQEEKKFPRKYSGLLPLLKKYQVDIQHYQEGKDNRINQSIANRTFFADNFSWYNLNDDSSLASKYDYFLTDPIYRNKVAEYKRTQLSNGVKFVSGLRSLAFGLIGQIKLIREGYTAEELKYIFREMKLKPFPKIACQASDSIIDPKVQFPIYPLFINLHTDTQTLIQRYQYNGSADSAVYKLEPGEFMVTRFVFIEGDIIEWVKNNECLGKYEFVNDGFLILE